MMLIDIFILIVCAIGTISSTVNATRADSATGLLFWVLAGGYELIATILMVIQIFI